MNKEQNEINNNEREYNINDLEDLNNININDNNESNNNQINSSSYYFNDYNNDFNDFSFEAVDFDTKFRSMQTINDTNNINLFHSTTSVSTSSSSYLSNNSYDTINIPQLNKDHNRNNNFNNNNNNLPLQDNFILQQQQNKQNQQLNIVIDSSNINVPEKPFYLGPSQFICALTLTDLIFRMHQKLDSIFEVSYDFIQQSCRWEAVYLRGSSRCKFELNLYKDSPTTFLIEGNRLSGDSVPYRNIFNEIKAYLLASLNDHNNNNNNSSLSGNSRTVVSSGIPTLSSPQPLPCNDVLQPDEAKEALQSILSMANSNHLESKIEAVKILCDLSYQPDMQHLLCDNKCIEILIEFMKIEHEYCNQFAICALANLSSSRACQSIMMKLCSSFVPLLLTSVADGPYENAEMRRECARTFANLCISHSSKIVNIVGTSNTSEWLNTIEELKDERLKLHAERAKNHLMACF